MLIFAPFLIAAYFELHSLEALARLALIVLLGSGVYAVSRGIWMPMLLIVILCLVSEMTILAQRLYFAAVLCAFAAIFEPTSTMLFLVLFIIWFLWGLDKMAGADLKFRASVILAFGSLRYAATRNTGSDCGTQTIGRA